MENDKYFIETKITGYEKGVWTVEECVFIKKGKEHRVKRVGYNITGKRVYTGDKVIVHLRNGFIPVIDQKI